MGTLILAVNKDSSEVMVDWAVDLDRSQITDEYDDVRKVQSSKHTHVRRHDSEVMVVGRIC